MIIEESIIEKISPENVPYPLFAKEGNFLPLQRNGRIEQYKTVAVREILLLGNPKLYEVCEPVGKEELHTFNSTVQDLHDTLMHFREQHGAGRAIAAPQIGVMKRLIYMQIKEPLVFINPILDQKSPEIMAIWDDCMCFPDLLVKVERHQSCRITYRGMEWKEHAMLLDGELSELLQHECDHLDGILAVSRAVDKFAFALKSQKKFLRQD